MIRGIKFVGVPVSDQDQALKFWTEAVGMIAVSYTHLTLPTILLV